MSINNQSAVGKGGSKRRALNEAYRKLVKSEMNSLKYSYIENIQSAALEALEMDKTPKAKLMEYAAKYKLVQGLLFMHTGFEMNLGHGKQRLCLMGERLKWRTDERRLLNRNVVPNSCKFIIRHHICTVKCFEFSYLSRS